MFVDEITIHARAGRGGDGVVSWRREKFVDRGGPMGGNGGHGGHVYMRAVRDVNLLARYTGAKEFCAGNGEPGSARSRHGGAGADITIDVPIGSRVIDCTHDRTYTFTVEGETVRMLKGGIGGLGNEHFKSATNRAPDRATKGKPGEHAVLSIELSLVVDVGIIGFPNAGKSTLLNALTRAHSRVGAYPFTTTEPHLGDFFGYILADIPGLIAGASHGKGLGHKFLRHIERTNMLMHCVSLEEPDVRQAYDTIRAELSAFDPLLTEKREVIVLTKADLVTKARVEEAVHTLQVTGRPVFAISAETGEGLSLLSAHLTQTLETHRS